MTEETINTILTTALNEAKALKIPITVSIVDLGGHLMALQRMEGCSFFGIEVSRKKAVTAAQLKTPTHILSDITQKIPELQKAFDKNADILTIAGGFPIFQNGQVIGGLGISGGDFNQDKLIAEKAVAAGSQHT